MYEAPDRYKRMISARLPDGESLAISASKAADGDASPLRDAQLMARAQLAPFFAAANFVAAWAEGRRKPIEQVIEEVLGSTRILIEA